MTPTPTPALVYVYYPAVYDAQFQLQFLGTVVFMLFVTMLVLFVDDSLRWQLQVVAMLLIGTVTAALFGVYGAVVFVIGLIAAALPKAYRSLVG